MVDMDARKRAAASEAGPFKEQATRKRQEAEQWKERVKELKKTRPPDGPALGAAEERVRVMTKEAREAAESARKKTRRPGRPAGFIFNSVAPPTRDADMIGSPA